MRGRAGSPLLRVLATGLGRAGRRAVSGAGERVTPLPAGEGEALGGQRAQQALRALLSALEAARGAPPPAPERPAALIGAADLQVTRPAEQAEDPGDGQQQEDPLAGPAGLAELEELLGSPARSGSPGRAGSPGRVGSPGRPGSPGKAGNALLRLAAARLRAHPEALRRLEEERVRREREAREARAREELLARRAARRETERATRALCPGYRAPPLQEDPLREYRRALDRGAARPEARLAALRRGAALETAAGEAVRARAAMLEATPRWAPEPARTPALPSTFSRQRAALGPLLALGARLSALRGAALRLGATRASNGALETAALALQREWRAFRARERWRTVREAALRIQGAGLRHLTRRRLALRRRALGDAADALRAAYARGAWPAAPIRTGRAATTISRALRRHGEILEARLVCVGLQLGRADREAAEERARASAYSAYLRRRRAASRGRRRPRQEEPLLPPSEVPAEPGAAEREMLGTSAAHRRALALAVYGALLERLGPLLEERERAVRQAGGLPVQATAFVPSRACCRAALSAALEARRAGRGEPEELGDAARAALEEDPGLLDPGEACPAGGWGEAIRGWEGPGGLWGDGDAVFLEGEAGDGAAPPTGQ